MTPPKHYRFLLDYVEESARSTSSIMFYDTEDFWGDILEAWERRDEKPSYWLFGTRWMREQLIEAMEQGTPRALSAILIALNPHKLYDTTWSTDSQNERNKRRVIACLLPILMKEMVQRVCNRSTMRHGSEYSDAPHLHPEDH